MSAHMLPPVHDLWHKWPIGPCPRASFSPEVSQAVIVRSPLPRTLRPLEDTTAHRQGAACSKGVRTEERHERSFETVSYP